MSAKEIIYDRNGKIVSGIVTAIFIALLFMSFGTPEELEEELKAPPVTIQFGEEDAGANDDADPWSEEIETSEPVEQPVDDVQTEPTETEAPTEPAAEEVVTDDSQPAVKPKDEPKPKTEPKKKEQPKEQPKEKPKEKPKTDKKFLFDKNKGKDKNDGKGKDGDNKKPGTKGNPNSGGDSPTGKIGVTAGGDIGGGLSGRGVRARSLPTNDSGKFGTVVVKICVNPDGKVISAIYQQKGSTTSNGTLKSLATGAAKKYKFQKNPNAPDKQCGTVTFKFRPG